MDNPLARFLLVCGFWSFHEFLFTFAVSSNLLNTVQMRYFYFLIAVASLFLTDKNVVAQASVYHPFPDSNTFWGINGTNIFNSYICHDMRFGINGDSVIGGKVYHKVYSLFDSTLLNPNSDYYAGIREENKRVYAAFPNEPELLLYDFNLEVGDTLTLCSTFSLPVLFSRIVTSVDSMQLYTGEYRKRWFLEADHSTCFTNDVVVEGLGSIERMGLFNPFINDIPLNGDTYNVECIKQDEIMLYLDNELCDHCFCTLLTPVEDLPQPANKEVYPNPFTETTSIRIPQSAFGSQLTLYNTSGQVVRSLQAGNDPVFVFNRENLRAGVYILQFGEQNKPKRSIKLIITDH